jgi:hypothetical protein
MAKRVWVFSVTASTTPGTLTNSGWTFGRKRTHEEGWTRRELVVAVANHHCNGPKPYLYSRIYQVFFQNLFTLYRLLSTPSLLSAVGTHSFAIRNFLPSPSVPCRSSREKFVVGSSANPLLGRRELGRAGSPSRPFPSAGSSLSRNGMQILRESAP